MEIRKCAEQQEARKLIGNSTFAAMHRKLIPAFFILLFLFNATGYFIFFRIKQEQIRHEVKLKLIRSVPENELMILSFRINSEEYKNLDWKEPHEFRYKGRMYDVSRQETDENGFIHFHCINDTQEEKLFEHLDEQVQNHIASNSTGSGKKQTVKKALDDYFFETVDAFVPRSENLKTLFFLFFNAETVSAEIPTPPPDLA